MSFESSINERVDSQLYSDVISSYVDINSITAQRNIVPGSYKETVVQATDQTLSTLNSSGGQTIFTRLKLTPQVRNATLAQLAQIYFQFYIKANSLCLICADQSGSLNGNEATSSTNTAHTEKVRFKLFYDTGFSIASMVQLCLTADSKISSENFNYQQSLLTLNSLPDYVSDNSLSETTLKSLVENENYAGVGSGIIEVDVNGVYGVKINRDIGIEGVIDLNKGNPLFHNFPIITRNMNELYIRLYMENFLRELKVVYLNKHRGTPTITGNLTGASIASGTAISLVNNNDGSGAFVSTHGSTNKFTTSGATAIAGTLTINNSTNGAVECLPYQRLPVDKADFIYLDGKLTKVKLCNCKQNSIDVSGAVSFEQTNPIYTLADVQWTRFEIRKIEFDIEEFEDIKASQAKAGSYKCPVHIWRSKNFDQTNAASSSANALQTTLAAPNIDRLFICQPVSRDYYTFLPTPTSTDLNPQLHNNPVLPRTEDTINSRCIERIGSVFVDTDKYAIPRDLFDSLNIPTLNKKLWVKSVDTYGGAGALANVQRGHDIANNANLQNHHDILIPNKFAYGLELNIGGCFRRGFNSVINGGYSPTVPVNFQQSLQTSANIYFAGSSVSEDNVANTNKGFNEQVCYPNLPASGAVSSIHCLCDYVLWFSFDAFGNMVDFGVSEFNDRN